VHLDRGREILNVDGEGGAGDRDSQRGNKILKSERDKERARERGGSETRMNFFKRQ